MKQKTILVCGGSGFIGTNLVDALLKKNFKVINIDKISYCSVPEKFKNYKNDKNYKFIKCNISNTNKIEKIILNNRVELIINLANDSHVDRSIEIPYNFLYYNLNSNLKLIDFLAKLQKKISFFYLHFSSDEVYGDYKDKVFEETDKIEPSSPYSASKAGVDIILNAYQRTFDFKYLIVRPCNQFGSFQFPEKFIPTIINSIMAKKKIPIYGTGENIREWMDVDVLSQILIKIISKKKLLNSSSIINLGSNIRCSNISLVKKIISNYNKVSKDRCDLKNIQFVKDRPGHDKRYSLNSLKLKKLNIQNFYNFEHSLKKTISWYVSNKNWIKYTRQKYKGKRQGLI